MSISAPVMRNAIIELSIAAQVEGDDADSFERLLKAHLDVLASVSGFDAPSMICTMDLLVHGVKLFEHVVFEVVEPRCAAPKSVLELFALLASLRLLTATVPDRRLKTARTASLTAQVARELTAQYFEDSTRMEYKVMEHVIGLHEAQELMHILAALYVLSGNPLPGLLVEKLAIESFLCSQKRYIRKTPLMIMCYLVTVKSVQVWQHLQPLVHVNVSNNGDQEMSVAYIRTCAKMGTGLINFTRIRERMNASETPDDVQEFLSREDIVRDDRSEELTLDQIRALALENADTRRLRAVMDKKGMSNADNAAKLLEGTDKMTLSLAALIVNLGMSRDKIAEFVESTHCVPNSILFTSLSERFRAMQNTNNVFINYSLMHLRLEYADIRQFPMPTTMTTFVMLCAIAARDWNKLESLLQGCSDELSLGFFVNAYNVGFGRIRLDDQLLEGMSTEMRLLFSFFAMFFCQRKMNKGEIKNVVFSRIRRVFVEEVARLEFQSSPILNCIYAAIIRNRELADIDFFSQAGIYTPACLQLIDYAKRQDSPEDTEYITMVQRMLARGVQSCTTRAIEFVKAMLRHKTKARLIPLVEKLIRNFPRFSRPRLSYPTIQALAETFDIAWSFTNAQIVQFASEALEIDPEMRFASFQKLLSFFAQEQRIAVRPLLAITEPDSINEELWPGRSQLFADHGNKFNRVFEAQMPSLVRTFPGAIAFFGPILTQAAKTRFLQCTIENVTTVYVPRDRQLKASIDQICNNKFTDHPYRAVSIKYEGENGIDQGGLRADWLCAMSQMIEKGEDIDILRATPNGDTYVLNGENLDLRQFEFFGRLIGLALKNGQPMGIPLSKGLIKLITHRTLCLEDLEDYDENVYRSMKWILENKIDDDLQLYFTANGPKGEEVELIPGGFDLSVNDSNKEQFVLETLRYILQDRAKAQWNAVSHGLQMMASIDRHLVVLSTQDIKDRLNAEKEINLGELRNAVNVMVEGSQDEIAKFDKVGFLNRFFAVLAKWPQSQIAQLLKFATGSSRIPVGGFECGRTALVIRIVRRMMYPEGHTCGRRLDISNYERDDQLENALKEAIAHERFDQS